MTPETYDALAAEIERNVQDAFPDLRLRTWRYKDLEERGIARPSGVPSSLFIDLQDGDRLHLFKVSLTVGNKSSDIAQHFLEAIQGHLDNSPS